MVVLKMSIGKRVANLRIKHKLTQEELAKRVEISRAALSHYEKDRREPDLETIEKIADYFDVTTDYLIGRTDDSHPDILIKDKEGNIHGAEVKSSTYDSLSEINKLVKQYGIEQMGFFDIEKWKNLSPHDVKMIEEHFKMIVKLAEEREKEE